MSIQRKLSPVYNNAGSFRCIMHGAANPGIEIGKCARAQRLLLGAARGLSAKRREQAEIDVHGLKRASTGIDRLDMVPGNVAEKRAERGRRRRQGRPLAQSFSGGETAGEQS